MWLRLEVEFGLTEDRTEKKEVMVEFLVLTIFKLPTIPSGVDGHYRVGAIL